MTTAPLYPNSEALSAPTLRAPEQQLTETGLTLDSADPLRQGAEKISPVSGNHAIGTAASSFPKLSFKNIALPLIARGIHVIPVQPFKKFPPLEGGGIERGSTDPARIAEWDAKNPDANVACLGTPDGMAYFDCDEPRLIARIQNETGRKFPRTFSVKAINGGGHLYFKQTERSRKLGNKAGEGVFELRGNNEYVMGPGSRATNDQGELGEYKIAVDAPFADIPDWLCDWIEANAGKKVSSTGELDEDSYTKLRAAYLENLNPEDMLRFDDLVIESLHPTLVSLAGLLHDGERTEEEAVDTLERIAEKYGHRVPREARNGGLSEIEDIVPNAGQVGVLRNGPAPHHGFLEAQTANQRNVLFLF
jgi:Bifunctional DNA primase/polymerase, N-terminal